MFYLLFIYILVFCYIIYMMFLLTFENGIFMTKIARQWLINRAPIQFLILGIARPETSLLLLTNIFV